MDFDSSVVKSETPSDSPFDVQGFKNLLETLKKSKEQRENKAKPLYESEA
jgi:hypothetical protein